MADILAAFQVIRNTRTALSNSHGAVKDYQYAVQQLEGIEYVFSVIENLGLTSSDPFTYGLINAINAQAKDIHKLVVDLLSKVTKYEAALGVDVTASLPHTIWSKIDWGTRSTRRDMKEFQVALKEKTLILDSLHKTLISKLTSSALKRVENVHSNAVTNHNINQNLLDALNSAIVSNNTATQTSLERIYTSTLDSHHTVQSMLVDISGSADRDRSNTQAKLSSMQTAYYQHAKFSSEQLMNIQEGIRTLQQASPGILKAIEMLGSEIQTATGSALDLEQTKSGGVDHRMVSGARKKALRVKVFFPRREKVEHSRIARSLDNLSTQLQEITRPSNQSHLPSNPSHFSTNMREVCARSAEAPSELPVVLRLLVDILGGIQSAILAVRPISTASIESLGAAFTALGSNELVLEFVSSREALVELLFARLQSMFWKLYSFFLLVFPRLRVFLQTINTITWSPSAILQDNINFEDVLGRAHSLQWAYFRNWKTFQAMLEHQFKGQPGESKVARDEYRILKLGNYDSPLDISNWEAHVLPGAQLVMSVLVESLSAISTECPRGCSGSLERQEGTKVVCTRCGIEVVLSKGASRSTSVRIKEIFDIDSTHDLTPHKTGAIKLTSTHPSQNGLSQVDLPTPDVEITTSHVKASDSSNAKPKVVIPTTLKAAVVESIATFDKHVSRHKQNNLTHGEAEWESEMNIFRRIHPTSIPSLSSHDSDNLPGKGRFLAGQTIGDPLIDYMEQSFPVETSHLGHESSKSNLQPLNKADDFQLHDESELEIYRSDNATVGGHSAHSRQVQRHNPTDIVAVSRWIRDVVGWSGGTQRPDPGTLTGDMRSPVSPPLSPSHIPNWTDEDAEEYLPSPLYDLFQPTTDSNARVRPERMYFESFQGEHPTHRRYSNSDIRVLSSASPLDDDAMFFLSVSPEFFWDETVSVSV